MSESASMSTPHRILVVDDEQQNRRVLEDLLTSLGYETDTASDGFEALAKLHTGFDLVLLDVIMPEMDGFEVIRRIRGDPQVNDIPIIMVTVLDDLHTRLRAVETGANDFISKPIDSLEVNVRVLSMLKMKRAQESAKSYRKELEETVARRTSALVESEKRFRTLFETARDGIFIKDIELRYTDVNRTLSEFFGISHGEFIGKTDEDLFGENHFLHTKTIESRVLMGQVIESQDTLLWKSLTSKWSVIRFPLRQGSDDIIGVCGIARELAERTLGVPDSIPDAYSGPYSSRPFLATMVKADIASETPSTILLTGETGSGKDHLARYIHDRSLYSVGPFVGFNCAAIPTELAESELFGHEAGAFTGAVRRKRGVVERAEGGTLLLNEIGDLSLMLQSKLLSFLDTLSFTRVGGEKELTVNVRLIAATSKDMESEVAQGRFRADLFYRLNVFPIRVPPLRERKEDIPFLATTILSQLTRKMGLSHELSIDPTVFELLAEYAWPGNVRELKNILERALILCHGGPIKNDHIILEVPAQKAAIVEWPEIPLDVALDEAVAETQRRVVQEALRASSGKKGDAARLLGLSRYAFARLLKKVGLMGDSRTK